MYDLIIIGGGPAGLTAALYAARAKLRVLVIEKAGFGGSIVYSDHVENFPGFPKGIPGSELTTNLMSQVMQYPVEFKHAEASGIDLRGDLKCVSTIEGDFSAKTLIMAGGAKPKRLGIPGEEEFGGNSVFYCAMCDGNRFPNLEVAIVGGGDGGITEGLYMTRIASRVTVIEILPELSATIVLQDKARANPKMEILCSTRVEAITDAEERKNLSLKNVATGETSNLRVSGIFVVAGLEPDTGYVKGLIDLDPRGFISVNHNMETSVPGIFAAGDIRSGSARQAVTAAGDGATAALSAERFLSLKSKPDLSELDF